MDKKTIQIQNSTYNNLKFNIRIVLKDDSYGLNLCLKHDKDEPLVEFYDERYPMTIIDGKEYGQFISRYYLKTLLDREHNEGLCLDGSVPNWNVDALAMNSFVEWINTLKNEQILTNSIPTKELKNKIKI